MKLEEYSKYYIQGSDHYLIPKDIFVELYKEMLNFRKETFKLKRQLKYLRSGEYYNQLRFENEMLQNVVDTNGVPSEVYDYIECTHRNTELLEENEQLKKELEQSNAVADTNKELAESYYKDNQKLKEQNERLLELCMYALISSTKIYNHELANDTKKSFIDIIKNNLNYDTYILKNKLLEAWRSDK